MSEVTSGSPKSKRIYCNRCKGDTNHLLRGSHSRSDTEDHGYSEEFTYHIWTCAGCDTGTLELEWTATGMYDGENQAYEYHFHPQRASQDLSPKVFRQLPKPLVTIYSEVVDAYNHRLHLLCGVGLRTLIEGICQNKGITGPRLVERIDGLRSILPENIVQNLHEFRFMGNEAAHELASPERETLRLAIDVSEDLLNFLYELDYKVSRLRKKNDER